jgi:hypothetical protein
MAWHSRLVSYTCCWLSYSLVAGGSQWQVVRIRFDTGRQYLLITIQPDTQLSSAIEQGDPSAVEQLLPMMCDELRSCPIDGGVVEGTDVAW